MSSASSMVDWDLAGRTARRLMSAGPADDARGGRRRRPRTARGGRRRRRARRGADRHAPGPRRPRARGRRRRPARLGRRQRPRHGRAARPAGRGADGEAGHPPRRRSPPRSAPGPPACRPASCWPSCPRVLGQYEIFGTDRGRLLLVAPNIVATERKLGVDPARLPALGLPARGHPPLQFTAVPWLQAATSSREIAAFVDATDLDRRRAARAPAGRPAQPRRRRPRR